VNALTLAAEGVKNPDLWYPTILGVLVVISAVGLFVGTSYLLLATNLGSRLGFLVTAAGLSGLMVLLSLLWLTTASPLNTLKGRIPSWKPVESIKGGDIARSKIKAVQDVKTGGHEASQEDATNIKAAVDAAVVQPEQETEAPVNNDFAIYQAATDYLVTDTRLTGGGFRFESGTQSSFPWVHVSFHKPRYAVVQICPIDTRRQEVPFGAPIPTPQCDKTQPISSLVLERDLGSVRVPPLVVFLASSILFGLSLLGLHWRERDLQEQAARQNATPATVPAKA
jgi:hypothetical protein